MAEQLFLPRTQRSLMRHCAKAGTDFDVAMRECRVLLNGLRLVSPTDTQEQLETRMLEAFAECGVKPATRPGLSELFFKGTPFSHDPDLAR